MPKSFQKALLSMGEAEYRDFQCSLMPTVPKERVIGIRIPRLRAYAKSLEDYEAFLEELPHFYFEENNLHAFLIERERDFDRCVEKLNRFLPYVDNWATCDSLNPKVLKQDPKKLLQQISVWLKSTEVYTVRFAILLLMRFFLDENFAPEYLAWVAAVHLDEYYVNMMRAWYFATALAKQYAETLPYFEKKVLDDWTHQKAIQKATESRRITATQKETLRFLKIKKI